MRRIVLGAQRLAGLSKKNGKPYDFTQLNTLVPLTRDNSFGYEQQQMDASPDVVAHLRSMSLPCECELQTSVDETSRIPRLIVVGVTATTKKSAAA